MTLIERLYNLLSDVDKRPKNMRKHRDNNACYCSLELECKGYCTSAGVPTINCKKYCKLYKQTNNKSKSETMKKVEIEIPENKKIEWVNGVLTLVDDAPKNIIERIKTFEDACNELGELNSLVVAYKEWKETSASLNKSFCEDIEAYLKLRIICAALNEGWQPKFTEDELRWYPWFYLYTQEDIDRMSDEWKQGRQVIDTGDYETEFDGFACASSYYVPSFTSANIGSRLCLKSEALATYCGTQFTQLWADFQLIKK